ncbi:DUF2304 domain-containing protein [Streptococcus oricebi]|uniref:DUF2304 domain-containing protein n=1 Tax=Streptococcus oricebi TaxID=1547447 RepID=A0ABS5B0Y9_9STRE|nr:DUF2304 domain-containing protein [Streptococcus oricebi]MBP2622493.1 DUF2304 domain-containing protein [Streptococcus oricebi]
MNVRASILIVACIACFLIYIIRLIVKKEIEMRTALTWLILGISILIVTLFPSLINLIAHLVGIYEPVNLVFFGGFCLLLYISFSLTRIVSKQTTQIRHLAQKQALENKKHEE